MRRRESPLRDAGDFREIVKPVCRFLGYDTSVPSHPNPALLLTCLSSPVRADFEAWSFLEARLSARAEPVELVHVQAATRLYCMSTASLHTAVPKSKEPVVVSLFYSRRRVQVVA